MNNIIDNTNERNNLLEYLNNKINNEEQKKFANDFYVIFFKNTNYIVDCKIIRKWLIYSNNSNFKRFFEDFLKEGIDYCIYKTKITKKKDNYIFTLKAFQRMLIKYDEELKLFTYLSELERDIKDYYIIYKDKLHNLEKNKLLEDTERLTDNKRSIIYIYNTDSRSTNKIPMLKIGLTDNLQERVKTYTTSHPNGLIVYQEEIFKNSLKIAEKWLHHLLTEAGYLVKSECFELSIEEAILWIKLINNDLKLTKKTDRFNKLSEVVNKELYIIDNIVCDKKILHYDISIQTDAVIEEIETNTEEEIKPFRIVKEPPKNIANFNKYLEECCIIDKEAQVSTIDIIGKYRIWSQTANKETYLDLLDYLKDIFKPIRIQKQDKNNVVNGYMGISLKLEEPFTLPLSPSKFDMFIYNNCNILPSNKVLFNDLKKEYIEWQSKINNDIKITDIEINQLKEYLNESKRLLKSNVWTDSGSGSGYYGISLKRDVPYKKCMTSSTAKRVEKVNIATNEIINSWNTIAKAAQVENISAPRMSRLCKKKK